jgi:hypothetical protein
LGSTLATKKSLFLSPAQLVRYSEVMELVAKGTYVQAVYTRQTIQRALARKTRDPLTLHDHERLGTFFHNNRNRNWPPDGYQEVEHVIYQLPPVPAIAFDLTKPSPEPTDHDYRHLAKMVAEKRSLAMLNAYNIANAASWQIILNYVLPVYGLHYTSPDKAQRIPFVFTEFRYTFGPEGERYFEFCFERVHEAWWMYMLAPSDGKRASFLLEFAFPSWVKYYLSDVERANDSYKREYIVPRYGLEVVVNTEEKAEQMAIALSNAWTTFTLLWESMTLEDMESLLKRRQRVKSG